MNVNCEIVFLNLWFVLPRDYRGYRVERYDRDANEELSDSELRIFPAYEAVNKRHSFATALARRSENILGCRGIDTNYAYKY